MCRWLVPFLLIVLFVSQEGRSADADIASDVRPAVERLVAAYQKLNALTLDGQATIDIAAMGRARRESVAFTSSFLKPNLFRLTVDGISVSGRTDDKVFTHLLGPNVYATTDAKADAPLPTEVKSLLWRQNPSLVLALVNDPLAELSQATTRIESADDVTIEGTSYPAIRLFTKSADVTFALDPATNLIRQVRFDLRKELESAGTPAVECAELLIDYTRIDSGSTPSSEAFAWVAPEGAREAKEATGPGDSDTATALVGKAAPAFSLKLVDGQDVSLTGLRGSVVVLDFWASWCQPCMVSLPHIQNLHKTDADVKVYAINVAEDTDKVRAVLAAKGWTFPVLLDSDSAVSGHYGADKGIPMTVVIDAEGQVTDAWRGFHMATTPKRLQNAISKAKGAARQ